VISQAASLASDGTEQGKQRAMNLLLMRSGLAARDSGLKIDRFDAIEKWAREGDTITIAPSTPSVPVIEPTIAEPVVEAAAKPSFVSVESVAAESVATAIVEEEILHELSVEEEQEEIEEETIGEEEYIEEEDEDGEEEEQEEEPVALPVQPIAVAPTFQRIKSPEISIWDSTDLDTIAPADIGNVNIFPVILVVAGQGNGKTVTMAHIFEQLSGNKAMYTPKMDDHKNPAIQDVYDLMFGYNSVTNRAAWYGTPESFDNSPLMDLDWYLSKASNKSGSALDFIHAANKTAENRTAYGSKKGRSMWRVFYDEAAVTYRAGFNRVVVDGVSLGPKGRQECQEFIAANLIPAIFNWRGAGVQLFMGCQSETVESVGLKGCAEARDEAWHLYPGLKAIEIAKKHKQSKLSAFLQRAISDGYAIAILEKEGQQFKIIRMPKLADLKRFDPIEEDDEVLTTTPIAASDPTPIALETEESLIEDTIEDTIVEDAVSTDQEVEGIEDTTDRMRKIHAIMALDIPVELKTELLAKL
jgi:hypothetical protein